MVMGKFKQWEALNEVSLQGEPSFIRTNNTGSSEIQNLEIKDP